MTATLADIGYDSTFGIESATPDSYTVVAEVVGITPPGMTRGSVEATHLKSPDRYKEFIPGLFEAGETQLTLNYTTAAAYETLATAAAATDGGNYQITFPDGATLTFAGFFTALTPPELTPEGKLEGSATIKPKGKPVFDTGA
jgi:hypothetical protein